MANQYTMEDYKKIKEFLNTYDSKYEKKEKKLIKYKKNEGKQNAIAFIVFYFLLALVFINCVYRLKMQTGLYNTVIYGYVMAFFLLIKGTLCLSHRAIKKESPKKTVSAVIPCYNEASENVMTIFTSLLNQSYPIQEIYFIDDGSTKTDAYEMMLAYKDYLKDETARRAFKQIPVIHIHRLPRNKGKRFAQAYAFEHLSGELVLTVDSDGYLYQNALEELVKPFVDKKVVATTGHVNALNKNHNFFTRLLDMRYDNAFHMERGAQSVTGNVLCCSGPISCYKASVICNTETIQKYIHQTVFKRPVSVGDDRCLTNYCIPKGKTVYQPTAQCDSNVPISYRTWIKQQIRWNKSFFRESMIALKYVFKKPFVALWTLLELFIWIFFLFNLVVNILLPIQSLQIYDLLFLSSTLFLSAYVRNVFYIRKSFLFYLIGAPVYGFIHLVTINFVRIYSLFTLTINRWGTR